MRKQFILTLVASLFLSACATDDVNDTRSHNPPAQKSAGIVNPTAKPPVKTRRSSRAPVSPVAPIDGIVIQHKNRENAALVAAAGGSLDRSSAGEYMDQQVEDLRRALQDEIEQGEIRVERRAGDHAIRITMLPGSGFDNLSSVVKPGFLATLSKIAPVLNQYGKTLLTVIGYIGNAGPDAGNQPLAERRAKSVSEYFINRNIEALRLQSSARAESRTRVAAGNNPPERRMELWIQPIVAP